MLCDRAFIGIYSDACSLPFHGEFWEAPSHLAGSLLCQVNLGTHIYGSTYRLIASCGNRRP